MLCAVYAEVHDWEGRDHSLPRGRRESSSPQLRVCSAITDTNTHPCVARMIPPRRADITIVLYTWTSAVSTHPCPTSRMVPSASNGTICYCLISEKLLMLPGSRGKCVKGGGTRIWQGLYKRSERHQRQEKGRKREMAEFESFSFPTKCHCSQLESSGLNHPEHLLVKHAAHRQIQRMTWIKRKNDIIFPTGAVTNIEIQEVIVVQSGGLSEALMTVIKQLKLHLHLKDKQE